MDSRKAMPTVAGWIDDLRRAFGKDMIDRQMQRGVRGEPVFYARENGYEVGTPLRKARGAIRWGDNGPYPEDYLVSAEQENAK